MSIQYNKQKRLDRIGNNRGIRGEQEHTFDDDTREWGWAELSQYSIYRVCVKQIRINSISTAILGGHSQIVGLPLIQLRL